MAAPIRLKDALKEEAHEEWVQYFVFPLKDCDDNLIWEEQLFQITAACQDIIGEYIWHNEPFALRKVNMSLSAFEEDGDDEGKSTRKNAAAGTKPPTFFFGRTRFGDNLEDEWFIVYLLRELTKKFPDIVVKVDDNDGEFLLIEASEHLPDWAESDETCKNRVYLYQGKVHLVPPRPNEPKVTGIFDLVKTVRDDSTPTVANEGVQKAVDARIRGYPQKMTENFQHATVMLPPKLAGVLESNPKLISSGCLAFYLRDPISLKASRFMSTFNPGSSLIKKRLRFTKCLYAMLMQQDFRPDRRSGWTLPAPSSCDYKAHSLGAKLTTGFELLLQNRPASLSNEDDNKIDTNNNPRWLRYHEALTKTGYFRGYLEGSKPHVELLERAQHYFSSSLSDGGCSTSSDWNDSACNEIRHIMKNIGDVEEGQDFPNDDDDSWMTIKPEDLDSLLEAKFHSGGLNPTEIPTKLKEFMKQISDFSGVESSSNNGRDSPRDNAGSGDCNNDEMEPFDFKADEFVSAMDKLLHDLGAPDGDWAASDDSCGSDEDELNIDLETLKKMNAMSKESQDFFGIMKQMDKELSTTKIGETFKATSAAVPGASGSRTTAKANVDEVDEFDQEELTPVNIDMNALTNMLQSFNSQEGPVGPSATLLRNVVGGDKPAKPTKKKKK